MISTNIKRGSTSIPENGITDRSSMKCRHYPYLPSVQVVLKREELSRSEDLFQQFPSKGAIVDYRRPVEGHGR